MTEKADKHEGTPSKAEIIWLRPDQLVPYGNNPRKNDKAVDAVAASIREFGFNVPITCDEHYVVATGHTRLKAAIKLGLDRVPVIVLKGLSEDQIKAWRLADNKTAELATWDEDKLRFELKSIVGIDLGEFGFKLDSATDNLKEDDYKVSLPKDPRSKPGDMYRLGSHTLLCGDATSEKDMARLMEGKPADMAMTDPPYNVDYEGEAGKIMNDAMTPEKWSGFMTASMRLLSANLKQGGVRLCLEPEPHRAVRDGRGRDPRSGDPHLEQERLHHGAPGLPVEARAVPLRMEGRRAALLHQRSGLLDRARGQGERRLEDEGGGA